MSGAETNDKRKPTILDCLNDDCWRMVWEYVPVIDIIRSERVSRKWQQLVLEYLQHIRIGIKLENRRFDDRLSQHNIYCWLMLRESDLLSFERWTHKLGSSVVVCYCDTEKRFKILGKNCPNLEAATLINIPEKILLKKQYENFMNLQWLSLHEFWKVSDECVGEYIASSALEGLEIVGDEPLTGQCLARIESTKLRYLFMQQCKQLEFQHLLAATDRLSQLTKLKLLYLPNEIYDKIHVLLDRMPKLEHLNIYVLCYNFREPIKKGSFFETVCRLANLKHFGSDLGATDTDLESVARSCKELRSLLLEKCEDVTGRGVAAACRAAGARLTRLGFVGSRHVTDDDVVACVRACPNLEALDVRFCRMLKADLLGKVRDARREMRVRHTLCLFANGTALHTRRECDKGARDGVMVNFNFSGLLFLADSSRCFLSV